MGNRRLWVSFCLLLIMLPLPARAQDSEAVPPWGRELAQPAPLAAPPAPREQGTASATEAAPCRTAFWIDVDYLMWWTRNGSPPPLITRGETSDARPGALDASQTKVIYGGTAKDVNFEDRHGARLTFGMPLGEPDTYAFEASYLFLTARSVGTTLSSPGSPVLARPFFDVLRNRDDSSLTTYPGVIHGSITVRNTSFLQGAETNVTAALWQSEKNRLSILTGFRYLNLNEDLTVAEITTGDAGALQFAGTNINVQDRFATWNDFYGGQVGLQAELHYRRLQLNLLAKLALGDSHETSLVRGRTVATTAFPIDAPAGLLALASNSGTFARNAFAVVPEVGAKLGFQITDRLTLFAGYTLLYWSSVARPADQIDLNLNPNLIPTSNRFGNPGGPARPAPGIQSTSYWAQGLNLGLTLRY